VNLWSADNSRVFVKFSKPAALATDGGVTTLNGLVVQPAPSGAPVFADAIAWFDCEVRQSIDFGTHTLFAGEITAAAIVDDDARAAAMSDTRMKYGGVKRH
jgi:flavin reductase (DIM6/NTAB) family NADH-FMN oxidoreductase RutF